MTLRVAGEYNLKRPELAGWSPPLSVDRATTVKMATPIFATLLFLPILNFSNSLPFLRRKDHINREIGIFDDLQEDAVSLEQNDGVPKCIEDVEPKFQLLRRKSEEAKELSHIVVLIHGFNSWPSVWSEDLARVILERDFEKKDIGALVVDWEKGAR